MSSGIDLSKVCVGPERTLREVMQTIDAHGLGIALVVDAGGRLRTTVTDGDVRRAILRGLDIDRPVGELPLRTEGTPPAPVTAPVDTPPAEILRLMLETRLRHIPLVDRSGRVVDLALIQDLVGGAEPAVTAVVMAGGFGARLRPLTDDLPKPMLPVGGRPLLERIIEQLRDVGIRRVRITTHHRPEPIRAHFGDGRRLGLQIDYIHEAEPLGTAGALGLIEPPAEPLLVINGDILTEVNIRAMLAFHLENTAQLTVGVRQIELKVPYGVVETEGVTLKRLTEKPSLRFFVNAGVYLLDPSVHRFIPAGRRLDMTELIERLLATGARVVSFPIHEYWLDIGQPADYDRAQVRFGGASDG